MRFLARLAARVCRAGFAAYSDLSDGSSLRSSPLICLASSWRGLNSVRCSASSGVPGMTRSGVSCRAPKAAPYAQAESAAVTRVVRRSSGEKRPPRLGRESDPDARRSSHTRDSGTSGSSSAMGSAGRSPVMSVYRHEACALRKSGSGSVGRSLAWVTIQPFTAVTRIPPRDANAWVNPSANSRCLRSGNNSASQVMAAMNSMQTPTKVRLRKNTKTGSDEENPARWEALVGVRS